MRSSEIDLCERLAKGVAAQFGSDCEVVVHDLQSENSGTIVAIENGHVTGREVGDSLSPAVLEALRSETVARGDQLAYIMETEDGKILKSSAIFINDETGKATGIFVMNSDITLTLAMEESLHELNLGIVDDAGKFQR